MVQIIYFNLTWFIRGAITSQNFKHNINKLKFPYEKYGKKVLLWLNIAETSFPIVEYIHARSVNFNIYLYILY